MKAVLIREHGGPDVLRYEEVATPTPGANEVLIEVHAASINHIDIWARKGLPSVRFPLPLIPGCDAAGIVREVGKDVTTVKIGTRVVINPGISCGRCEFCSAGHGSQCVRFTMVGEQRNGSYAQFLAVPEHIVLPIPDDVSFEKSAAAALVYLTAWSMLIGKARLKPGEDVLILGVGGCVGVAALQIAKLAGCRVYAAAGSEAKLEKARLLGADVLINYSTCEFDSKIRELTGRRGVDVVVDYIGAETWVRSLRSVRKGGKLVTCGATTGYAPQTDLRQIFYRQLQIFGSTMGSPREFSDVMQCVFRGDLDPIIDRVLPLDQARAGHEAIEARAVFGKIILSPNN
jgi:NADPH:quinone reductase-like Zn-dependent oxidoreductase